MAEDRLKELLDLAKRTPADAFVALCPGCFLMVTIPGGDGDDEDLEFHTEILSVDPRRVDRLDTQLSKDTDDDSEEAMPGTYLYEVKKQANNGWLDWIAIGRAKNNDVIIRHQSVSKLHARIHCEKKGIKAEKPGDDMWITDMNSSSGTWTNSNMLQSIEPRQLSVGDSVRFGQVDCQFLHGKALHSAILNMS